ncbi:hypothetical protein GCM10020216_047180 [Nonomuraea helvata]
MDGNVHKPATCCPGEASISDTTGLEVSTRAYCHSDHGPDTSAPAVAVDCTTARTRHRTCQPFCSPVTAGDSCEAQHVCPVKHVSSNVVLCPDQIRPVPWPVAAGSCSTSASSTPGRRSTSEIAAVKDGLVVGSIHLPVTNWPTGADTMLTAGPGGIVLNTVVSTRADTHSDHGPDTPDVVVARARQRICHPSVSFPDGTTAQALVPDTYALSEEPDQISPAP